MRKSTSFACITAVFATTLLVAQPSTTTAQPITFYVEGMHSSVAFVAPFMSVARVRGGFDNFIGTIVFDKDDLANSSAYFMIRTASVNTNAERRDKDLRSEKFFACDDFPTMSFTSARIERSGDDYAATGALTLHGVTKSVTLPFSIVGEYADDKTAEMGLDVGPFVIKRTEYGVGEVNQMATGRIFVGDDIDIEILLRLRGEIGKKKAYADENPRSDMTVAMMAAFEGNFASPDGEEAAEFALLDGRMTMLQGSGGFHELIPIADNTFRIPDWVASLEFERDGEDVTAVTFKRERRGDVVMTRVVEAPLPERAVVTLPVALLDKYAGTYRIREGFDVVVTRSGDHLTVQATGQQALDAWAESETGFFIKEADAAFIMQLNSDGTVKGLLLKQGGSEILASRV